MRTRFTTATIGALTLAGAISLSAQTPQTSPSQPQTDRQRPSTGSTAGEQSVTVTGCVKQEKDVPGRTPNVAERAGIGDDYILTNVKMSSGSSTSGMGLAQMYELKGVSEAELKKHVGHQVEVMGRLSAMGSGSTAMSGTRGTGTSGTGSSATGTSGTGTSGTGTSATGTTGTTGSTSGTTGSTSGTAGSTSGTTGSTSGTSGTTGRTGGQAGSNADLPELQATSIKMIAATCPAQ
jgi:hypothetical protein